MEKHFVVFGSPGTFMSESTEVEVESWDVDVAKEKAKSIKERHGATPYGFRFVTRTLNADWTTTTTKTSGMYFLGGRIETIEEIFIRQDPDEKILRSNMQMNGWDKVIINSNSYKVTLPFTDNDTLLCWP